MDPIPLVEFDIRGTNPKNTIPGEKWNLKDKTLNWYLPNGSPFFGEAGLVVMYNEKGAVMKRDRDYFVEGEFVPFCTITGRSICSYIRLSDDIVKENAFVKIDYQSLGAYFVPRNDLQEWIDLINSGKTPIPWSKVFGVPPTLPPEYHLHDAKTEIMDWYDFTQFFMILQGIRETRDATFNDRLSEAVEEAYDKLKVARDDQLKRLQAHDSNYYNPHEADAFDIDMGNHPNYATATPADDLAGTRSDLLSTPYGVIQLAKTYTPDTDRAMLAGIMPISQFGGESYIPPNITGSYEGLGSRSAATGICLEPNGLLMMLSNHFDGRTTGLYYSFIRDYKDPNQEVIYTGYKFVPPVVQAQGYDVDSIVPGSNGKVCMVGKDNSDDWWVALTNGTFDPGSHQYSKCDVSAIMALFGGSAYLNYDRATIHHMGDYLVLCQPYGTGTTAATNDAHAFFRIKTADVLAQKATVWERFNVTYQNYDGATQSNVNSFRPTIPVTNSAGAFTRNGPWTYDPPMSRIDKAGRTQAWSCPNPSDKTTWLFSIMVCHTGTITSGSVNGSIAGDLNMVFKFNPATGVMTKIEQTAPFTFQYPPTPAQQDKSGTGGPFHTAMTAWTSQSAVFLDNGVFVVVYPVGARLFPIFPQVTTFPGITSADQMLDGVLPIAASTVRSSINAKLTFESPTLSGVSTSSPAYEADGEIYGAARVTDATRQLYFRKVSGGYQVRDGITNLGGQILSRPLTNDIYLTNLLHSDILISMTGSAAELTAGGVECGSTSMSACGYSSAVGLDKALPVNPALRAPAGNGCDITFPKTYSRVLDKVARTATYKADSFYGIKQALIDKIKTYIPSAYQNSESWCFSLYLLKDEAGGMFHGLNLGLIVVNYLNIANGDVRTRLLQITPVIEAPNASHPGVDLITDFTVVQSTADARSGFQATLGAGGFRNNNGWELKPFLTLYRNGANITAMLTHSHFFQRANLSDAKMVTNFVLNTGGAAISSYRRGMWTYQYGEVAAMVPIAGLSTVSGWTVDSNPEAIYTGFTAAYPHDTSGAAAAIFTVGSTNYLLSSVYPESGWLIFIQSNIRVMFNGATYETAGGTIDLRDVDPAPQNKTFYMYITVEDDEPVYLLSAVKLRKSNTMMRVATLVTNDKQILTITREQPFMVSDLLLSYAREGGIIPMSVGFPQDEGQFVFLQSAELLP